MTIPDPPHIKQDNKFFFTTYSGPVEKVHTGKKQHLFSKNTLSLSPSYLLICELRIKSAFRKSLQFFTK